MQFHTSIFTILASLAAMTSAIPAPIHGQGAIVRVENARRTCIGTSNRTPAVACGPQDALGDDTSGTVVAMDY
ncbi:hypothetical protein PC116_g34014 [Phytophthora cactorum]|nr:hypothetical protein PC116_g34014 [Phytophthora cactorum]